MSIRLHDTLTGETRDLDPLQPGRVGIYSCGPTVYNPAHLGNFRTFLFADLLRRTLRLNGWKVYGPAHIGNFRSFLFADLLVRHLRRRGLQVTWVMNVTDIDDKIIRGAAAANTTIQELSDHWLAVFR